MSDKNSPLSAQVFWAMLHYVYEKTGAENGEFLSWMVFLMLFLFGKAFKSVFDSLSEILC